MFQVPDKTTMAMCTMKKASKGKGAEKVNGPRRLTPAEYQGKMGNAASMVGDMVESGQNDQWSGNERWIPDIGQVLRAHL